MNRNEQNNAVDLDAFAVRCVDRIGVLVAADSADLGDRDHLRNADVLQSVPVDWRGR